MAPDSSKLEKEGVLLLARFFLVCMGGCFVSAICCLLPPTKEFPVAGRRVASWNPEPPSQLIPLFTCDCVLGMLERKDYHLFHMVFPFICAFAERAIGYIENSNLTGVNTM